MILPSPCLSRAAEERVVVPVDTPPPDDDVAEHFANASNCIWGVPTFRPNQLRAAEKICYNLECEGKLPGSGKSHIVRLVCSVTAGVIVVIVPLLALSSDQM